MNLRFSVLLLLAFPLCALAAASATAPSPTTADLTVYPRPMPTPALKYRLIPADADRRSGNAALLYFQAILDADPAKGDTQLDHFETFSLDKLPLAQVRKFLHTLDTSYDFQLALQDADLAARCDTCDWQWAGRRAKGLMVDSVPLERFRFLCRLITLKARLEMARGRYDQAARRLGDGLDLAHRLGQNGNVLHALNSVGILSYLLDGVQEWMQQPNAPNLYWSLANLPRPFYDMRAVLENDRATFLKIMPQLKGVNPHDAPPDLLLRMLDGHFIRPPAAFHGPLGRLLESLQLWYRYSSDYPKAKAYLRSTGLSADTVDHLGFSRAVGLYIIHLYQRWSDRWIKLAALPYWQARPQLAQLESQWKQFTQHTRPAWWVAYPAHRLIYFLGLDGQSSTEAVLAQNQRRIAVLQTIEAVSAYAAAHHGDAPDKLEDLTDCPAAIDPFTGRLFQYQRTPKGFELLTPYTPAAPAFPTLYRVTLAHVKMR